MQDLAAGLTADEARVHAAFLTRCPCCTAPMRGSDHCPECGCEEYESYCDHVHQEDAFGPLGPTGYLSDEVGGAES